MSKSLRPLVPVSRLKSPSLLGALALGSLGLSLDQPGHAAAFTGICPVLGVSQPDYPSPFTPEVPPGPIALPQTPVTVTLKNGSAYPICAVYMSIEQSGKPVSEIPVSGVEFNFPELDKQPWYLASGDSLAKDFANALIDNGTWSVPNPSPPPDSTTLNWNDDGFKMLVNEKLSGNPNDSNYSAYFLWKINNTPGSTDGKPRVVFFNNGPDKWDANASPSLAADKKYWYWVLDAPGTEVPGPLPLLGAGAAFGWSRRLRQRVRQASAG